MIRPRGAKPFAQCGDDRVIGALGEEFDERIASDDGKADGDGEEEGGEKDVGPGVEGPLAGPG